jgi:hypothetical protein
MGPGVQLTKPVAIAVFCPMEVGANACTYIDFIIRPRWVGVLPSKASIRSIVQ